MSLSILTGLLKQPELTKSLVGGEWNAAIQAARQTELLGQLGAAALEAMPSEDIPWRIKRALDLELLTTRRRGEAALWELQLIRRLVPKDIPLIVLKGCAYVLANDRNAAGRFFSDIDLLVGTEYLGHVQAALISGGWKPSQLSEYDQKYYHDWMHEVPPMEHVRRHTTVDLHHAIIPPVSRYAFDPTQLHQAAIEVKPGIFVLSPADRIIHSAVHAFQEGVAAKALRDLYDISCLVKQHFPEENRHAELISRSDELGLKPILLAALQASRAIYGHTPGSSAASGKRSLRGRCLALAALNAVGPKTLRGRLMEQLLLAHSHWMKMPWSLLVPHLIRKTWLRLWDKKAA